MLNTDDVVVFGYMLHGGGNNNWDDAQEMLQGMNVIIEKLRKEPFVVAITRSNSWLLIYVRIYIMMVCLQTRLKVDGKARGNHKLLMRSKDGFQPELEEGIWVTEKVLEDWF
ncbi:MAG: hypothetical protein ACLU4N_07045 [Butyricimonas faecihominis]